MYQLKGLDDTIAAISTAAGAGGIGIVRLSGKKAVETADKMFQSPGGKKLAKQKTYTVHYGWIVRRKGKEEELLDEVLVTLMRSPHSYTKEDVVEISCHGGAVSQRNILTLATELGARLAQPGEFTKRAFLNGRIDLTQAEAVLDIVQSKTDAFLKVSTHQLKGELATQLEAIREELMQAYVELEAIVNFPEDDVDTKSRKRIDEAVTSAQRRVEQLLATSEQGRVLKEGIKIVICGKPNVGKSSLLNVLLKQPRAIVSDISGTTRDTIEETATIKGIAFQLIDTAGILEPRDLIEEEAVKRSRLYIEGADLVLLVLDHGRALTKEDDDVMKHINGGNVVLIVNKCDLPGKFDVKTVQQRLNKPRTVEISVLKKQGIERLEEAIVESVWQAKAIDTHGLFISNLRHIHALKECQSSLKEVFGLMKGKVSLEFVSEEIKIAVNYLDAITGRNIDSDLLDQIFSRFCIGK
ncbi:MAG TPA: tRNA uridine-5-carboxymethylaminomethyl(34) synthesis GTPase MnmE [Candidatus Omnitrophota bacterium]|nr:tRNA uridine-5-carboxymethylaminomethyl(34) synthesis GTPase MnmE [Candidatus Omnitrophota bacterium]